MVICLAQGLNEILRNRYGGKMLRSFIVLLLAIITLSACSNEEGKKKQAQKESVDKVYGNLNGTRIKKTDGEDEKVASKEEGLKKVFGNLPDNRVKKD